MISYIANGTSNVGYWHIATIQTHALIGRCWTHSDIFRNWHTLQTPAIFLVQNL